MWSAITQPGLNLLDGRRRDLTGFCQELAHEALQQGEGHVLWCDGDHGFDPYHMAELNMERGHAADEGAQRLLIKRCMTAFQWDTVLTKHLAEKLEDTPTDLVVIAPFDRLFVHDELRDWEQEDYVRFALPYLRRLAKKHDVPMVLSVDMARWWQSHPVLAQMTYEAVQSRWRIDSPGRWRAQEAGGEIIDPHLRAQVTLHDWEVSPRPQARKQVLPNLR